MKPRPPRGAGFTMGFTSQHMATVPWLCHGCVYLSVLCHMLGGRAGLSGGLPSRGRTAVKDGERTAEREAPTVSVVVCGGRAAGSLRNEPLPCSLALPEHTGATADVRTPF